MPVNKRGTSVSFDATVTNHAPTTTFEQEKSTSLTTGGLTQTHKGSEEEQAKSSVSDMDV